MYDQEIQLILDYAKNKTDDIEIMLSEGNSFSVRIHNQKIEAFNYSDSKGIGVRVLKNGKAGYSYTEEFNPKTFRMIVDKALENCELNEDNNLVILDNYPDLKNKPEVFSKELEKVDLTSKIELTKKLESNAKKIDKRIINVPYSMYADGSSYLRIVNSRGLDKNDHQNFAYAYVGVLAADQQDKRMGFDFIVGRDFNKFDPEKLARTSVEKSIALLGGKEISSGQYPVVFNNEMMATLLSTFSGIFSAQAVQEGKSLLKNKLNKKITSEKITIYDDALHPDGLSTRAFDSEGYPSQKTILIENGKLINLLHNTITARKDGVKSTGNASRGYKESIKVSPSNLYLKPGKNSPESLLNKYNQVLQIVSLQGMHAGANPVSGDFSLSAEGFLYENGIRKNSLKQFTVSGNILKILEDVMEVGNDFKFNMNSVGAPSILIEKLSVSG